jgi:hypothetical protein
VGTDSVFALLHGGTEYDRVTVSLVRDAAEGVTARVAPTERAPVRGRELARHFSGGLPLETGDGRVYVRARLFEIAPDGSRYLLYLPALQPVDANRSEIAASYDEHVRGWVGNGAGWLLRNGAFGPTLPDGGDGTAEARYLETAELVTRQFMRGAEWAWDAQQPRVLLDYFPLGDEVNHMWLGLLEPRSADFDADVTLGIAAARARAWEMVDLRLAQLQGFADASPGTLLLVVGDHGFRTTWREFRPNALLREAGLLRVGEDGEIELEGTAALSPNGYWINVNRTERPGGAVRPEDADAVLDRVETALRDLRDEDRRPVVTRIYRAADHPELGLGGPAGGDLYFETAEGVRWSISVRGAPIMAAGPGAGHGFPSTSEDMWTAFCAAGPDITAGRFERARLTDAAPTISEWLGIEPPRDATGESRLDELRGSGS